jgi:glycine/D-amino acid oxidase-like deaminating enzyme/nitrite reductase/ring-hydroxylating ferredoxin subunit
MTSLWMQNGERPRFATLAGGLHVDVAIIGAGITGITAAVLLAERGKSVAVLEKETVGSGETGRTTAHITESLDARYHSIRRHFGLDGARVVAGAMHAAVEQVASFVDKLAIDCDFRRLPGYFYTEKRNRVADLKSEAASAKDAGLAASWTMDVPLPFLTRGGVRFEYQARFHPLRYLLGLASRVAASVYEHVHVLSVEQGDPCVLETSAGRVTAGAVFVATNAPINDILLHTRIAPYRTYAFAAPFAGPQPDGLFWDTAEPYHYTRWHGESIIVGGGDHKVGEGEGELAAGTAGDDRWSEILGYARERYGPLEPSHRWSGQIIEPADGLPYIGAASDHLYLATGYSGQGMSLGTAAGMLVADLIDGRSNEAAELFSLKRPPLGGVKELVTENLGFPRHFLLDRFHTDTNRTFDVKGGEGKIVSAGGRRLAVHRDDTGTLHALSPVCRHLGCDVAWNSAERTWDCPCHGSRYSIDGKVLNGPATEALERVAIDDPDQ